jgi:hypothetical protein
VAKAAVSLARTDSCDPGSADLRQLASDLFDFAQEAKEVLHSLCAQLARPVALYPCGCGVDERGELLTFRCEPDDGSASGVNVGDASQIIVRFESSEQMVQRLFGRECPLRKLAWCDGSSDPNS